MSKNPCWSCGAWDSDREGCTMPECDKWYACPIESEKPENKAEMENYLKWLYEQREKVQNDER